jgi:hypothetical protein
MNKIEKLCWQYSKHIGTPWQSNLAAPQRVIFCVYNEEDERKLRAKIGEFDNETQRLGHGWAVFDLTDTFAVWLSSHRYSQNYFEKPELISTIMRSYLDFLKSEFGKFLETQKVCENTVVALIGVGSLFGFLKIKQIVDNFASLVEGRLLVFFPGTYENNNHRLLNAYDDWNYLAVTITANDKELQ